MNTKKFIFTLILGGVIAFAARAQHRKTALTIKADKMLAPVQPVMWGVFFEDVNMGADGGLYAELVKNRSFEFYKPLMGWTVQQKNFNEGAVLINRQEGNENNPRFLRVSASHAAKGALGIANEGFRGMGIKKEAWYSFSAMLRQPAGSDIKIHIELANEKGDIIGNAALAPTGKNWEKITARIRASVSTSKGKLNIWFEGNGVIDIDMISLFPEDTWKSRPGGLRRDMAQLLADIKPGFMRFPGGCIVEGYDLSNRFQWKKTIGPIENRKTIVNRWNMEFAHRSTPDYFQTFGLGFFEYFQLSEDIGAAPVPILNCGMACQFNTGESVPVEQLSPYIQDALDLIEFANGDANSKWGKVRADMGHPESFNLTLLGVGNENWGPQYAERLSAFQTAIKEKYPQVKLIASAGPDPDGGKFDYMNRRLREMNIDIIDEHYYREPKWFLQNVSRYDKYDRLGPKIFVGEYAAHADKTVIGELRNNWGAAVAEAAFLTGLERNADIVVMASYAPLFAHAEGWQWAPCLMWADNLRSYGSPSYYVQKLFSSNRGTHVIPVLANNLPLTGQDSLYASAVWDKNTKDVILKIVNYSPKQKDVAVSLEGVKKVLRPIAGTVLSSDSLEKTNSLDFPLAVSPQTLQATATGKKIEVNIKPYSLSILRIKVQ